MKLLLQRDYHGDDCTMGVLSFSAPQQDFSCHVMERPWIPLPGHRGGLSGKSCVPPGYYKLERHNSEAHPHTWALVNPELDVVHYEDPLRTYLRCLVLIHVGNYCRESRGCLLPGRSRSLDDLGVKMVTQSRLTMIELKRLLPWDDSHELVIK